MSDDVDILRDELADAIDEVLDDSLDPSDYTVKFKQPSGIQWCFCITFDPDALDYLARAADMDDE